MVLVAVLAAPTVLLAAACSRPPEQQILSQFFRAARFRDNATLALMSAVSLDPREDGIVERFSIDRIGEERRTPVNLRELVENERRAREAEAEFTKRKTEYQNANLQLIEQVIKLERQPNARMNPAQQKVKAEWDKWRADTTTHARQVSEARAALTAAAGPIEASLTQPGAAPFDPSKFEGAIVAKDVTINASMRLPDGAEAQRQLTITLQRAEGTLAGQTVSGRWIITRIQGLGG